MIILGIDPGSRKAGYALLKGSSRKVEYITSGVLRYDKVPNFLDRIGFIFHSVKQVVDTYKPQEFAFESLIYVKNVSSLAKLSQARGAMIAACQNEGLVKIHEYTPNLIKSSVAGFGHADKIAVEKSLSYIFGKIDFKTSDESDAVAIALCHWIHSKNRNLNLNGARR